MADQMKFTAMAKAFVAPLAAAALIIGGGAFYGGMQYAESKRPAGPGGAQRMMLGEGGPEGTLRMRGDGQQGGFRGGQGDSAGGFVSGEIIAKDDMSVTVKLRDGGSKIILYSTSTEIGKFVDGAAADLEVGKTVMATGKANQDGSVTAQTIQLRPDGAMMPTGRFGGDAQDAPQEGTR